MELCPLFGPLKKRYVEVLIPGRSACDLVWIRGCCRCNSLRCVKEHGPLFQYDWCLCKKIGVSCEDRENQVHMAAAPGGCTPVHVYMYMYPWRIHLHTKAPRGLLAITRSTEGGTRRSPPLPLSEIASFINTLISLLISRLVHKFLLFVDT